MMRLCVVLVVALVATAARAAPPGPRDSDWPCQQIKVPQLSLASVWSGAKLDEQTPWQQDPDVAATVHRVALRRVPVDQAQDDIRAFAKQAGDQKRQKLLALAVGVFDERRQALSYVCDVPAKIEQRLFALAQTIQQEMQM